MKAISLSVALALCLISNFAQADEGFSMKPYLQKCGGKVYAKCDSAELNQNTIFEAARAEALSNKKEVMFIIGADWCGPCLELHAMFKKDKDLTKLHDKVVVVEINADVNSGRELAKRLNLSDGAYPTAFILKPQNNELVQKFPPTLYSSVAELIASLSHTPTLEEPTGAKPTEVGKVLVTTLELPIEINGDYGASTFYSNPQTTTEQFINQGVAALQIYHYVDAYRSFRMAERSNPDAVMAYVGEFLSLMKLDSDTPDGYFERVALKKLETIRKGRRLTVTEEAWADFARAYQVENIRNFVNVPGRKVKTMTTAFADLRTQDPENLDGHALAGWFMVGSMKTSALKEIFQSIIAKRPDNLGAHHSLMHIAEGENDTKEANVHAPILAKLAPRSPHALHMVGHTLPQQGRWAEALEYFKQADALHQEWAKKNGVEASQDWHYAHNLSLMAASYLGLGDTKNALSTWFNSISDQQNLIHIIDLAIATSNPKAEGIIKILENAGNAEALKERRQEFELTPEKAKVMADSYTKGRGTAADFEAGKSTYVFGKLMRKTIAAYGTNNGAADPALSNEITGYFSGKFKEGGFDGWSNSYLELLRLKRVAKMLSLNWLSTDLDGLEFAVQSGALCTPGKK